VCARIMEAWVCKPASKLLSLSAIFKDECAVNKFHANVN